MSDADSMLRLVFAAVGCTGCLVLCGALLRTSGPWRRKAALALYALVTPVSFVVALPLWGHAGGAHLGLFRALGIVSGGEAGAIWLAMAALFGDRELPLARVLPVVGLMVLIAPAYLGPTTVAGQVSFWLWEAASAALTLQAVGLILGRLRRDRAEARRRPRFQLSLVCAAGCGIYLLMLAAAGAADLFQTAGVRSLVRSGSTVAAALGVLAVVMILLEPRPRLLPAARAAAGATDPDAELAQRLEALMRSQAPWRDEGLTLGGLAARLDAPEYRLRRVINGRLGRRNFAAFVNGFRVDAAKGLLCDPARRLNVAQVAYEVGFSSLAPFNRAFKEATGVTPSDWRREMLIES